MKLTVDTKRAELVVARVHAAFRAREGLLAESGDLIENQIPPGVAPLSRDHAAFLFYTVANDHGMKSSRLYAEAKLLFAERRQLFDPREVVTRFSGPTDPELVEATGRRLRTRYPSETAKSWFLNSEKLLERFGGDPLALLRSAADARELLKQIIAFRGYGPKIGGILLRAAIGLGFSVVRGVEQVLVPVDIHDARISFLTGILREAPRQKAGETNYYAYVKQVQQILLDACNARGIQWLDADRGLWLIGSRGCVERRCSECPLRDVCTVGVVATKRATRTGVDGGISDGPPLFPLMTAVPAPRDITDCRRRAATRSAGGKLGRPADARRGTAPLFGD